MKPAVTAIAIHGPSSQSNHQYHRHNHNLSTLSTLDHYFLHPQGSFNMGNIVKDFASLTYTEYYALFHLAKYDTVQDHWSNYYIEQPNTDSYACHTLYTRTPPYQLYLQCLSFRRRGFLPSCSVTTQAGIFLC